MPQTFTSPARTTRLDERSFEQLLAAAFIIQEHNKAVEKPQVRELDFTKAVSAAAALQEEIAPGSLDLPAWARLIAERALQVTSAQGVAVGIVVDDCLTYIGAAGTAAGDSGRKFPVPQSLPARCILKSEPLQLSKPDRLPRGFAGRDELQSLIATPVIQKGTVLGVFELRFSEPREFSSEEVRAAELFAGAVNLSITTAAKKHAAEIGDAPAPSGPVTSAVQPATEKAATAPGVKETRESAPKPDTNREIDSQPVETLCTGCGRVLFPWESFCARCGSAKPDDAGVDCDRSAIDSALTPLQSPVAPASLHGMDDDVTFRTSAAQSDLVMPASEPVPLADSHSEALAVAEPIRVVPADAASSEDRDESAYPWSSAQKAREWFEGLREQQRPALTKLEDFWQTQKANIWLGASAIILLFAIIQFFAAPVTPSAKADNSDKVAAPQLTFFEGLLVSLGLAEAPPAISSYTGNPEARVWVDTRTALYYCEGTGQYGKTPAGKFTSQRDAQQDQFEPAHRKVCP